MKKWLTAGEAILFGAMGIMGCSHHPMMIEKQEEKFEKAAPLISQSFASPRVNPLETWKVYLIASDPDGDMKNIVCTIDQPGVGTYPLSFIRIQDPNQKQLSGYIYLKMPPFEDLNFVDLTLTVQIQDRAGHYSPPAVFPLSINNTFQQEPPPPGVFKESDLGPIMIQLRTLRDEDGPGLLRRREPPFRR